MRHCDGSAGPREDDGMRVYVYHTQEMHYILEQCNAGKLPTHLLYGAMRFDKHGVDVVWNYPRPSLPRWRRMLHTAWCVLAVRGHIDAVYATHYDGLEIIVLLRALRLFRHPVIVWHHPPIITPRQWWRDLAGRLFYRGFDRLVFFSQKLVDDSLASRKVSRDRLVLGHWGADLSFYDGIKPRGNTHGHFISTGKELRDMPTLISAFDAEGERLDIYVGRRAGGVDYEKVIGECQVGDNVKVHFLNGGNVTYDLSVLVARSSCVVICCKETNYTVGLTTLVEALALGLPVICSRNPNMPIDVGEEGCGISVPYYDVEGWRRAIRRIADHPDEAREMGRRGRALAERLFNDENCAMEMADVIKGVVRKSHVQPESTQR